MFPAICWHRCQKFESFVFEGSTDEHVVIGCFEIIAHSIEKETVIVLDNAPIHRSARVCREDSSMGKTWLENIFSADLLSDTKQNRNAMGKDKI